MEDKQTDVSAAPQGGVNNPQPSPQAAPSVVQPPQESGENNRMVLWLIVGLVVIILVVGGIYFYSTGQQKVTKPKGASPTPVVQENLENEVNAINVEDIEGEFSEVDKDLGTL